MRLFHMKMLRMTTRRWMVVVAGLAILFARPARFHGLARVHERARESILVSDLELYLLISPSKGDMRSESERGALAAKPILEIVNYHNAMSEKYKEAARRPWLPVAADPPSPPTPSREYQAWVRQRFLDEILRVFRQDSSLYLN